MSLKVYVWDGGGNCDWTCGDLIVIAKDKREAKKLAGPDKDGFGGPVPRREPDHVLPLEGFVYVGPGGA